MVPYDELYDTVRGLMASEYAVAGVENLFAEGSYCQRRYDDMRQAYAGFACGWAWRTRTGTWSR